MTAESWGTVLGSHRRCLQASEGRGLQGRPGPWGGVLEAEGWGEGMGQGKGQWTRRGLGCTATRKCEDSGGQGLSLEPWAERCRQRPALHSAVWPRVSGAAVLFMLLRGVQGAVGFRDATCHELQRRQ